ncbi:MAG: preprotein translocase subunit YajC [Clostridiales bacterium]|jgi:preprotein translocase subunit YajC|nr:preprotein translocase subunit YajC [Clostridiales bacterium]
MLEEKMEFFIGGQVFATGIINAPSNEQQTGTSTTSTEGTATTDVPAEADAGGWGGMLAILPIYAVMGVAIWFFLFRPQKKREKQMKEMQEGLKVGDNIITSAGFFGKIVEVGQEANVVEFGVSGRSVRIPVKKSDILGIKMPVLTPPHVKEEIK